MSELSTERLEKFVSDIKTDGMCDITDHQVESALIRLLAYEQAAKYPVAYRNKFTGQFFTLEQQPAAATDAVVYEPVFLSAPAHPAMTGNDAGDLIQRLSGRAQFLRSKGEVKTPELIETAISALSAQLVRLTYKLPDVLDFDCEFENGDYDIDEEPWLRGRVDGFNEALQVIKRSVNTKHKPAAQESE